MIDTSLLTAFREELQKKANIDIGNDREINFGVVGSMLAAPIASKQAYDFLRENRLRNTPSGIARDKVKFVIDEPLLHYKGDQFKTMLKHKWNLKGRIIGGAALLGAVGSGLGYLSGKGIERAVFPYKKPKEGPDYAPKGNVFSRMFEKKAAKDDVDENLKKDKTFRRHHEFTYSFGGNALGAFGGGSIGGLAGGVIGGGVGALLKKPKIGAGVGAAVGALPGTYIGAAAGQMAGQNYSLGRTTPYGSKKEYTKALAHTLGGNVVGTIAGGGAGTFLGAGTGAVIGKVLGNMGKGAKMGGIVGGTVGSIFGNVRGGMVGHDIYHHNKTKK